MTLCLFFQAYASTPAGNSPYRTRLTSTYDGLPSDNVQQVLQDSEGYTENLYFGENKQTNKEM